MSEFLFFIIGTMLGGLFGVVMYVLLADKQTFREKGSGQCEKEMCRYFSV